jgi:hypothetical protein
VSFTDRASSNVVTGAMRTTHETVPTAIASINESRSPAMSRPGIRALISSTMPAMRNG